jgi:pimeloyl-ACP methyl ester carboxylesterase
MEPSTKGRIWKRVALGALSLFIAGFVALAYSTDHLAHEAELDYPELGKRVTADGVELHYVERGRGRPVLLLHGAFGAVQDFTATVFDPLAHKYHAIAFDRPGHGYSQRPAGEVCTPAVQARILHDALVRLGIERPVLVGFSWSGALVLAYGLAYPSDVSGIVTLNGVCYPWPGTTNPLYLVASIPILGPVFTHALVMPMGEWTSRSSIERAFDPEPVPMLFSSSPVPLALRPDSYSANAEDIRVLKDSVREQCPHYGELRMPLVIVVAEDDQIVTPKLHSHALH